MMYRNWFNKTGLPTWNTLNPFYDDYVEGPDNTRVITSTSFDLNIDPKTIIKPEPYKSSFGKKIQEIKKVIFNDPATIVYWSDGTKTVVKCGPDDIFDPEKGLAMAICKRVYGNDNHFHKVFKKWLPKDEPVDQVDIKQALDSFSNLADVFKKIFTPSDKQ